MSLTHNGECLPAPHPRHPISSPSQILIVRVFFLPSSFPISLGDPYYKKKIEKKIQKREKEKEAAQNHRSGYTRARSSHSGGGKVIVVVVIY